VEPLGIVIVVLWLIAGFFNAAKKRSRPPTKRPAPRAPLPPAPTPEGRRGGGILDQLRAELERIQREAELAEGRPPRPRPGSEQGPSGRPARIPLPEAEEVEEVESLEVEPVVTSWEAPVRPDRAEPVARDQQIEAVTARRLREAEARNQALTLADHKAFDRKVRAAPTAAPRRTRRRPPMQQAMIWREVLGPPIALRDREP